MAIPTVHWMNLVSCLHSYQNLFCLEAVLLTAYSLLQPDRLTGASPCCLCAHLTGFYWEISEVVQTMPPPPPPTDNGLIYAKACAVSLDHKKGLSLGLRKWYSVPGEFQALAMEGQG